MTSRRTSLPAAAGAACLLTLTVDTACESGRFVDWVYRDAETAWRVGPLPETWHRIDLSGGDVAFRDEHGGSILATGACGGANDVPLDVLTNQAVFGVEQKQERSRATITLDGRTALRTHLLGSLDGVQVELDLVVVKKDNCTYDLQLVAGPDVFASRVADFDAFVGGFHQLPRASR